MQWQPMRDTIWATWWNESVTLKDNSFLSTLKNNMISDQKSKQLVIKGFQLCVRDVLIGRAAAMQLNRSGRHKDFQIYGQLSKNTVGVTMGWTMSASCTFTRITTYKIKQVMCFYLRYIFNKTRPAFSLVLVFCVRTSVCVAQFSWDRFTTCPVM